PLASVLPALVEELEPPTTLAHVQRVWAEVAGPAIAREAEPVSERSGVLSVACRSAVWAQEIELMSADLVERLNAALKGAGEAPPLRSLRVSAGGVARSFP
nr:DUF721 domain-containing protein [Actinomycetota bacterium]